MVKTRKVKIGNLVIGGGEPIRVQSMCTTLTSDIKSTVNQVLDLEEAGCEIIRVSVPDMKSAIALKEIKKNINIPLVADIHYDYRLALESSKYVDKLRINPGNIGSRDKIKSVINAAKEYSIPIRIGVNLASLEKDIEKKYGLTPRAMLESARKNIKILEEQDFNNIIVALKASDVLSTIKANRMFKKEYTYPIHLGITESGTGTAGVINSAVGMGVLLEEGIGDTIRVSLSDTPVNEVKAGFDILKSLHLRNRGVKIVSCPTCARAKIDVINISKKIENETLKIKKPLKIVVMGCEVNGPGEVKKADFGVFGAKNYAPYFKLGKIEDNLKKKDIVKRILEDIKKAEKI